MTGSGTSADPYILTTWQELIASRGADKKTLSETGWQSTIPYTFTPPSNCEYITIVFSNSANTNCTPSDFGDLQINKGSTAQTYASPAWS